MGRDAWPACGACGRRLLSTWGMLDRHAQHAIDACFLLGVCWIGMRSMRSALASCLGDAGSACAACDRRLLPPEGMLDRHASHAIGACFLLRGCWIDMLRMRSALASCLGYTGSACFACDRRLLPPEGMLDRHASHAIDACFLPGVCWMDMLRMSICADALLGGFRHACQVPLCGAWPVRFAHLTVRALPSRPPGCCIGSKASLGLPGRPALRALHAAHAGCFRANTPGETKCRLEGGAWFPAGVLHHWL